MYRRQKKMFIQKRAKNRSLVRSFYEIKLVHILTLPFKAAMNQRYDSQTITLLAHCNSVKVINTQFYTTLQQIQRHLKGLKELCHPWYMRKPIKTNKLENVGKTFSSSVLDLEGCFHLFKSQPLFDSQRSFVFGNYRRTFSSEE